MFLELSRILLQTMKQIQWYFECLRFYPAWYEETNFSYHGEKKREGEKKEMKTSKQTTHWSSANSNQLTELRRNSFVSTMTYML